MSDILSDERRAVLNGKIGGRNVVDPESLVTWRIWNCALVHDCQDCKVAVKCQHLHQNSKILTNAQAEAFLAQFQGMLNKSSRIKALEK